MKTNSRLLTVTLVASAIGLSLNLSTIRADDGIDGGDIEGTESLNVDTVMTPAAAAPAGSSIQISLEADDDNGANSATLRLENRGLFPGTYSVSTTLKSDGSTVVLGTFTVDDQGEAEIEFGGDEGTPFPVNFNPFDIATVSVVDANSVVLFTADLTHVSGGASVNRTAAVQAMPGSNDPNAAGTAVLNAFWSHARAKGSLQLSAHGLPPHTQLMVSVNGLTANTRKVNTNNAGNVNLRIHPKGKMGTVASGVTLFEVTSLRLTDKFGNVLLSADF
jgi:hypothetical protein